MLTNEAYLQIDKNITDLKHSSGRFGRLTDKELENIKGLPEFLEYGIMCGMLAELMEKLIKKARA